MSNRDMAIELLNHVPDYKIGYVLAYLQGLMIDESADDAFCDALCQQYEADPDKGEFTSLADAAKQLGVSLE